jgi:hypothetical protein
MKQSEVESQSNRRSFLKKGALTAGLAMVGGGLFGASNVSLGQESGGRLTKGDIAILRFLAAAELIESDLWLQYAELGGVTEGTQNNYQMALQFLDSDGSQYITSNTIDEISHANFLNGYLESKGADPVNLDEFRILLGSTATGAQTSGVLQTSCTSTSTPAGISGIAALPIPTLALLFRRQSQSEKELPSPGPMPTSRTRITSRRLPIRPPSTSGSSNKADRASTQRLARRSAVWKC